MDRTARNGRLGIQGATEPRFFVGVLRNKGKRGWKRSPTLIGNALQANRADPLFLLESRACCSRS
jgi:hypothetical protein